jgi:hypothetical protein
MVYKQCDCYVKSTQYKYAASGMSTAVEFCCVVLLCAVVLCAVVVVCCDVVTLIRKLSCNLCLV